MPKTYNDTSETAQTPEWSDQPDEDLSFGAYAVSSTEMYRDIGESIILKVHAWSSRGELVYIWYDPANIEMQEESDTLTLENLTDNGENMFGTYRCVVSDGTEEQDILFQVLLDSSFVVNYNGESTKKCYIGEPVNLAVTARDFKNPENEITYQWYLEKTILDGETAATLTIPYKGGANRTNKATYRCEVSNGTTSVTKEFQITTKENNFSAELVTDVPHDERNGHNYYCNSLTEYTWDIKLVNYNPYATYSYTWREMRKTDVGNRRPITSGVSESKLTFQIRDGKIWEYSCDIRAKDINGNSTTYTLVNYAYPIYADVYSDDQTTYTKPGNPAFLALNVHAAEGFDVTAATYQWYKKHTEAGEDDILLSNETKDVLWFPNVTEDDFGEYFCRISWGNGESYDVPC